MSETEWKLINEDTCERYWSIFEGGSCVATIPYPDVPGASLEAMRRGKLILAAVNACARLGFEDPAELEEQVRELVKAAAAILDDADATVPFERQAPLVQRLHAALAPFKEAPDADG
jgi:hypothetical protein